jgi:hypothetical protein
MVKLKSRTIASVHREAETALLATQLLLSMTAAQLSPAATPDSAKISPRRALREFRREFQLVAQPVRRPALGRRLATAVREERPGRRSPKAVARVAPPHPP